MEQVKRNYINPEIELIRLDNEISLALESDPMGGPDESFLIKPEYKPDNPFKTNHI